MARADSVKTHLQNLVIKPTARAGDAAADVVLAIQALDAAGVNFSIKESGAIAIATNKVTLNADGTANLAGNVTIATTKIALNADGSAAFAGNVASVQTQVLDTSGAVTLDAAGALAANGTVFIATKSDGATTLTLPAPSAALKGVHMKLLQMAAQNFAIAATTGKVTTVANAAATTATAGASGSKIGGALDVVCLTIAGPAYTWFVTASGGAVAVAS